MFHVSVLTEKSFNRLVLVWLSYLHGFFVTMHDIDTAVEVYLKLFQPYMIEFFTKIVNGLRIK